MATTSQFVQVVGEVRYALLQTFTLPSIKNDGSYEMYVWSVDEDKWIGGCTMYIHSSFITSLVAIYNSKKEP